MNDQLLASFIALVTFDQKINFLYEEREKLLRSLEVLDEQKATFGKQIDDLKSQVHAKKKEVDVQELTMKLLDNRETEKKRQLDGVSSTKEYTSLKNEINAINQQQRELEQELIAAWDSLDSVQKKYQVEQAKFEKIVIEYEQKRVALDLEIEHKVQEIRDLESKRKMYLEVVPEEILQNYEHMRGRVQNPVVQVEHNSCSACFYPVPAQDLALLRRGNLVPCKSCYRILYIKNEIIE